MALSQIEEKYINLTLSMLYEQALEYRRKTELGTGNTRDRAIWKALYVNSIRTYNRALANLSMLGTSTLAREAKPLSDKYIRELGYEYISDEDIDYIVGQTYGISRLEREKQRYELQKLQAKAFVVGSGSNKKVQAALETLVKHGAINKLIPLDKLIEHQAVPELPNLPRGNPRKGGLVAKYLSQGKSYPEAVKAAEDEIYEEDINYSPDIVTDRKMQEAIAAVTEEHGSIAQEKQKNQEDKMRDFLSDLDPEPKDKSVSLADLNPFEEGGFK